MFSIIGGKMKNEKCNHCQELLGESLYVPLNTSRDSKIYICKNCGLCQTKQNLNPKLGSGSLTSDAGYGNVRRAKGVRLDAQKKNLAKILSELPRGSKVLDIGSSRGQFLVWCVQNFPDNVYYGIEPDSRFAVTQISDLTKVEIGTLLDSKYIGREKFDFIFCNHTLEHFDDALANLKAIRSLISESGTLWVDVPNLAGIKDPMGLEEFFLDKHTFHYEKTTLVNILKTTGFQKTADYSDELNLAIAFKTSIPTTDFSPANEITESDLKNYAVLLKKNREKLPAIARKIEAVPNAAVYGAGRILDALVKYGNLNHVQFTIADKYLWESSNVIGIDIRNPREVSWSEFDTVFILARSSETEIQEWLKSKSAKKFIKLSDLW
jgi:2-polyprenyl-3-methyl-5-hydroxy-6-metoxy-1,4-benzoquinol methylase